MTRLPLVTGRRALLSLIALVSLFLTTYAPPSSGSDTTGSGSGNVSFNLVVRGQVVSFGPVPIVPTGEVVTAYEIALESGPSLWVWVAPENDSQRLQDTLASALDQQEVQAVVDPTDVRTLDPPGGGPNVEAAKHVSLALASTPGGGAATGSIAPPPPSSMTARPILPGYVDPRDLIPLLR